LVARKAKIKAPDRPYQIGGARLELHFPDGFKPKVGVLKRESGLLEVEMENAAGESRLVRIETSMHDEVSWIEGASGARLRLRPTWEWTGEKLEQWDVLPPTCH
jgi:hypothetical protein